MGTSTTTVRTGPFLLTKELDDEEEDDDAAVGADELLLPPSCPNTMTPAGTVAPVEVAPATFGVQTGGPKVGPPLFPYPIHHL